MKKSILLILIINMLTACGQPPTEVETTPPETAVTTVATTGATVTTTTPNATTEPESTGNIIKNSNEYVTIGDEQYSIGLTSTEEGYIWCETNDELQKIAKMKSLVKLNIGIDEKKPDFTPLVDLSYLRELTIISGGDIVMDLSSLSQLKNITTLSIYNRSITDICTIPLGDLTNLTDLSLIINCEATDLSSLSELGNLTSLYIFWYFSWGEYDVDIAPLTELPVLENLYLQGNRISNYDLAEGIPNLKEFYYTPLQNFLGVENKSDEYIVKWSR